MPNEFEHLKAELTSLLQMMQNTSSETLIDIMRINTALEKQGYNHQTGLTDAQRKEIENEGQIVKDQLEEFDIVRKIISLDIHIKQAYGKANNLDDLSGISAGDIEPLWAELISSIDINNENLQYLHKLADELLKNCHSFAKGSQGEYLLTRLERGLRSDKFDLAEKKIINKRAKERDQKRALAEGKSAFQAELLATSNIITKSLLATSAKIKAQKKAQGILDEIKKQPWQEKNKSEQANLNQGIKKIHKLAQQLLIHQELKQLIDNPRNEKNIQLIEAWEQAKKNAKGDQIFDYLLPRLSDQDTRQAVILLNQLITMPLFSSKEKELMFDMSKTMQRNILHQEINKLVGSMIKFNNDKIVEPVINLSKNLKEIVDTFFKSEMTSQSFKELKTTLIKELKDIDKHLIALTTTTPQKKRGGHSNLMTPFLNVLDRLVSIIKELSLGNFKTTQSKFHQYSFHSKQIESATEKLIIPHQNTKLRHTK